jgi:hypothetical protein
VARIGENADGEQPLQEIDGTPPDNLPRPRDLTHRDKKQTYPIHFEDSEPKRNWLKFGLFEPIPQNDLLAAREVWHQQGLSARMVTDFTATASGELFLYVNDAIQLLPFGGPFNRYYYNNNGGSAEVSVQRKPLPPPEK